MIRNKRGQTTVFAVPSEPTFLYWRHRQTNYAKWLPRVVPVGQTGSQSMSKSQCDTARGVLAYFRGTGAGWQTRMEEALRE